MMKPSSPRVVKVANTALPSDFKPGKHDVVCSRGRHTYNLIGNRNFRQVIDDHRHAYTQAFTRAEKSVLIIEIVGIIRRRSPRGGFIRFCKKTKRYVEIGDARARDKVGHAFREAISLSTKDTNVRQPCRITSSSGGITKVSPVRAMKCKEAMEKIASTCERNAEQFCDKPLPIATAPHQMPLLATFAAEFNFDGVESSCSSIDMGSAELRLMQEELGSDDDQSTMGSVFDDHEDWLLLESLLVV